MYGRLAKVAQMVVGKNRTVNARLSQKRRVLGLSAQIGTTLDDVAAHARVAKNALKVGNTEVDRIQHRLHVNKQGLAVFCVDPIGNLIPCHVGTHHDLHTIFHFDLSYSMF
jgi:hypothetical protein